MIEMRNILCPVDFSDNSKHALEHAIAIAHRYGSRVTLLYVCPGVPAFAYAGTTPMLDPFVLTDADRERLTTELQQFADSGPRSRIRLQHAVREGDAVSEILAEAASVKADLVALGTHGRSGFERLFLGSVTEKLLRKADCPILTVPPHNPGTVPVEPELFKRIVCPIDFSECSQAALTYAMSMAQENDAQLVVLYVAPNDLAPLPGQSHDDTGDHTLSVAEFLIRREEHVRRLLQEMIPDTVRTYCNVETMMTQGKPETEILRVAGEHGADLIVIGVRGRGAVDLTIFGSTTQQVVRLATCPVLTIRHH